MAGILRISDNQSWSAANWVYWGLMDHVLDALASDPDVAHRMEVCKWMQSLSIPLLREDDPKSAEKVVATLKHVADRCANGDLLCTVEGKILESGSQQQFRESMHNLVGMLDQEKGTQLPESRPDDRSDTPDMPR
jgi:hypothetical protein